MGVGLIGEAHLCPRLHMDGTWTSASRLVCVCVCVCVDEEDGGQCSGWLLSPITFPCPTSGDCWVPAGVSL